MTDAKTLAAVASWCDEEYRLLSMLRFERPDGYDAQSTSGRLRQLAEMAGFLRSWASDGRPPQHQRVRDELRIPYERLAREDEAWLQTRHSEDKP